LKSLLEWHRWFAWYPVPIVRKGKLRYAWLRFVERKWGLALTNSTNRTVINSTIASTSRLVRGAVVLPSRSGGPHVAAPIRQGFGTSLLKATFPDARFDYAIEGLSCEIDIPLGDVGRGTINVIRLESKPELNKHDSVVTEDVLSPSP
jgi:hypothetical protein